ncbi:MAG: hypothetical protein LBH25_07830 [Fibromonadaceae bacterium]|jgi:uncharacterized protein (TIGR02145 family)|nr:hypothetical protein [Fibromonadaceae bacterium]
MEQPHETVVWDSTEERGTFTDSRDGKTYKATKIGEQVWMAENLNYNVDGSKCYGEGGPVHDEDDREITLSSSEIQANCDKYGRLYDWATAMKACPKGWHLPSNAEWDKLYRYVDGISGTESPYVGRTAGKYLKAKNGWNDDGGKSGNGEDTYGFSALPGGNGYSGGYFLDVGNYGNWYSSSDRNDYLVYYRIINYYDERVGYNSRDKNYLFSVRCVEGWKVSVEQPKKTAVLDRTAERGTFTDTRDGKAYKTTKIGTQTWMAENLNYEAEGSRCYGEGSIVYDKDDREISLSSSEIQANCNKYGKLYDWATAMKACPKGWHLPSEVEWKVLTGYVGNDDGRSELITVNDTVSYYYRFGTEEGIKLKSVSGWDNTADDYDKVGTDEFGFSALPGGSTFSEGYFAAVGTHGTWWSSLDRVCCANSLMMCSYRADAIHTVDSKSDLHSVRCVRD